MKKKIVALLGISLVLGACDAEEQAEEPQQEESAEVTETASEEESNELPEEIQDLRLTDTRDDTTGNWKYAVTSADVNMPDNALAYYEEYMDEGEVHHIISFATNTTTMISDIGSTLMVDITEYEDNEEHSADTIGSGMLLNSYDVNKESGEIEEVE